MLLENIGLMVAVFLSPSSSLTSPQMNFTPGREAGASARKLPAQHRAPYSIISAKGTHLAFVDRLQGEGQGVQVRRPDEGAEHAWRVLEVLLGPGATRASRSLENCSSS